jgi:RNA polymerase sigma-70 factor (ECF subfamily)
MVKHGGGRPLNESDIRRFLEADYPRLVNGLALLCGSFAQAEDAVQEALARAWERSQRGIHVEEPAAWVAAVAANLLRDRWRRVLAERRARGRLEASASPRDPVVAAEGRADVMRALASLPRKQREVAVFRWYLDLDVAEVARALEVPEGTVKSALHRARQSLAQALGADDETEVGRGSPPAR